MTLTCTKRGKKEKQSCRESSAILSIEQTKAQVGEKLPHVHDQLTTGQIYRVVCSLANQLLREKKTSSVAASNLLPMLMQTTATETIVAREEDMHCFLSLDFSLSK